MPCVAPKTQSRQTATVPDPFYGHKDIALLSEFVINQLFSSPGTPSSAFSSSASFSSMASPTKGRSGASTPLRSSRPVPRLGEFIAYSLYRTRLAEPILFSALLLLRRLKTLYPTARGTPTSPHRLFLSALMLSAKICCDDTYSNASWVIVSTGGGMEWKINEVNQMERELFGFLKWDVVVHKEELEDWEDECRAAWEDEKRFLYNAQLAEEEDEEDEDDEVWIKIGKLGARDKLAKEAAMSLLKNHPTTRHFSTSASSSSSTSSSGFSTPSRRQRPSPYQIPPRRTASWVTNHSISSSDDDASPNLSDSSTSSSSLPSPQGPRTPEFNFNPSLDTAFSKSTSKPQPFVPARMDIYV